MYEQSGGIGPSSFAAFVLALCLSDDYTISPVSLCNLKQTIVDKSNEAIDIISDDVGALNKYILG